MGRHLTKSSPGSGGSGAGPLISGNFPEKEHPHLPSRDPASWKAGCGPWGSQGAGRGWSQPQWDTPAPLTIPAPWLLPGSAGLLSPAPWVDRLGARWLRAQTFGSAPTPRSGVRRGSSRGGGPLGAGRPPLGGGAATPPVAGLRSLRSSPLASSRPNPGRPRLLGGGFRPS